MYIKRIGVFSFAKLQALTLAVVGLIFGLVYAFLGSQVGGLLPQLGYLTIVVLPILYAIVGFIGGMIIALLVNLFLGLVGGVEVEFVAGPATVQNETSEHQK